MSSERFEIIVEERGAREAQRAFVGIGGEAVKVARLSDTIGVSFRRLSQDALGVKGATDQMSGSFRQAEGSGRRMGEVQKVNNKLTGDFTKLVSGAGIAMATFGSIAGPVLNKVNGLIEEGFHQIKRLTNVLATGVLTGEFAELSGPAAEQAMILEEQRRRQEGPSRAQRAAGTIGAGLQAIGAGGKGIGQAAGTAARPLGSKSDAELDEMLETSLKKSGALLRLRQQGLAAGELEILQTKSLAELQQRVLDRDAELAKGGIEEAKREAEIAKARARAGETAQKAEEARLDRIVGIVSSLDQQYAAQVKVKEVTDALMEGVRDFGLPIEYANELIQKQKDMLMFELHPAWDAMLDDLEKRTRALSADGDSGLKRALGLDGQRLAAGQSQFEFEEDERRRRAEADRATAETTAKWNAMFTAEGGLSAGIDDMRDRFAKVGDVIRDNVGGAVDDLRASIKQLVTEGKFDLDSLAGSLASRLYDVGEAGLLSYLGKPKLPGAQHGADFRMPSGGGPDSQLLAMRVSPRERIIAIPEGAPGNGGGGGPGNVRVVVAYDAEADAMAQLDAADHAAERVVRVKLARGGAGMRNAIRRRQ